MVVVVVGGGALLVREAPLVRVWVVVAMADSVGVFGLLGRQVLGGAGWQLM